MRLITLTIVALIGLSAQSQELLIAKIASPLDEKTNGKFVTLYNPCDIEIDFDASEYYLARETNGGGTFANKRLVGKVAAHASYVLAGKTAFTEVYKLEPNCVAGCVSGNGNDAYYLYKGGNETTGILIDIYGAKNTDGLGSAWDYTNSLAERKSTITMGNTTWTSSEWEITIDMLVLNISPWSQAYSPVTLTPNIFYGNVTIYPNPTKGNLNISAQVEFNTVTIYTMSGSRVKQITINPSTTTTLETTDLLKGIYIIEINGKTGQLCTKQMVKQ